MSLSYPARILIVNALLRGQPFSFENTYLALFSSTSELVNGTTNFEITGGGYARTPITWGTPIVTGAVIATNVITPIATSSWGPIGAYGICNSATGGIVTIYGAAASPNPVIGTGQSLKVNALQVLFT